MILNDQFVNFHGVLRSTHVRGAIPCFRKTRTPRPVTVYGFEIMSCRDSKSLLLCAGVASFDMVSGIRVIHQTHKSDRIDHATLCDVFKIVLGNVHRQSEQAYQDASISTVELQSLNCLLVSSIFVLQKKRQSVYYSVGLLFDTQMMPQYPEFIDVLVSWSKLIAKVAKLRLAKNFALKELDEVIELIDEDTKLVSHSGISLSTKISISESDFYLYALLLTAHFHTQMTIVIESANSQAEHAQQIARFLAHFSLPYQRQMSSLDLLSHPSPHLYIQCVEQQSESVYADWMLSFDRPVTWVKLPERRDGQVKISQSKEPLDVQRVCHENFVAARFVFKSETEDGEMNRKFGEIREKFAVVDLAIPAPWTLARMKLLLNTPEDARSLFCEVELASIMRCAISLVAWAHDRLSSGMNESMEKDLQQALGLLGKADWDMVLALARLYSKDVAAKLAGQNQGRIRAFSSLLGVRKG